ncbi:MAG: MBL fold metallo-hydrolase [Acidobacteriota bacterium]|nr:MBL fold metallo-hydrolase [Acidobacteriota bacterium]
MKHATMLMLAYGCWGLAFTDSARAQQPAPPKPDTPESLTHIENARNIAGTYWAKEEKFLCETSNATATPRAADPGTVKLFDNLYAIPGTYGVGNAVLYILKTSAGLIMIDTGSASDVETIDLPGFKALGLNPADIKVIIIPHGHADHFGGAPWFQEHINSVQIYMAAADWDFITKPAPAGRKGAPPVLPRHDKDVVEGQPIVLGDEQITPIFIPGHTPGTVGLFFPVKDGGEMHVAAIFGGGFLAAPTVELDRQFIESISHFEEWAAKMHADVELMPHPVMDNFADKLTALRARKPGEPNPFVVGRANYTKFLDVLSECSKAALARYVQ